MVAIFCFEIPTYWDLKYSKHFLFIFLFHVKADKVLPSRQMIRGYADSEGVAPGYSDTAFQANG